MNQPAGTADLAIPKLRQGSYCPGWLERRRRAEAPLVTVVATSYVLGVSTSGHTREPKTSRVWRRSQITWTCYLGGTCIASRDCQRTGSLQPPP